MVWRFGGLATVAVCAATATCGLLLLAGVGPSTAGVTAPGDTIPPVDPTSTTSTVDPTTTTTTTSTTTSTTTTTVARMASPVPISVTSPSQGPDGVIVTPAGGVVTLEGQCEVVDGAALGPVEIWVINGSTSVIQTGVSAAAWTYDWTAPADGGVNMLQVWCGDPTGYADGYPLGLQLQVSVVDVGPPPTIAAGPAVASSPIPLIPETD